MLFTLKLYNSSRMRLPWKPWTFHIHFWCQDMLFRLWFNRYYFHHSFQIFTFMIVLLKTIEIFLRIELYGSRCEMRIFYHKNICYFLHGPRRTIEQGLCWCISIISYYNYTLVIIIDICIIELVCLSSWRFIIECT